MIVILKLSKHFDFEISEVWKTDCVMVWSFWCFLLTEFIYYLVQYIVIAIWTWKCELMFLQIINLVSWLILIFVLSSKQFGFLINSITMCSNVYFLLPSSLEEINYGIEAVQTVPVLQNIVWPVYNCGMIIASYFVVVIKMNFNLKMSKSFRNLFPNDFTINKIL